MNKKLFEAYASLKIKEKEVKAEIDKLNPQIVAELGLAQQDKAILPGAGSFSLAIKKIWKFSHVVERAGFELEGLKDKEKQDGTASFT